MVGEKFEIYSSQLAKHALKLSTMFGEKKLKLTHLNWLKNTLKLPTMLRENGNLLILWLKI